MAGKSSLQNVLTAVLAVGNSEQNFSYAPWVFQSHFNSVTSFLIDRLVAKYPEDVDVLLPFLISLKIAVTSGYVQLPDNYRNLIGAPSINVRSDGSDCDGSDPVIIDTPQEVQLSTLKAGCKSRPIVIVDKSQWDYLTTSTYDYPTYENPIGMFIGGKRIKVCPFDIGKVEVTYAKNEQQYVYGYITQPDDTFIFDLSTSVESEWGDAAFEYLFKGCLALYSAYTQDQELKDFNRVLINEGIL